MPFCEACARHWTPSSMNPDGTCPSCSAPLPRPGLPVNVATSQAEPGAETSPDRVPVPWHFTLLLIALVLYLGLRAYQGVAWLVVHLL